MTSFGFNCGCGFQTTKLEEAQEHVKSTNHTIHVLGVISPDKWPEPKVEIKDQDVVF